MSANPSTDTCRLTIVAPTSRIDVSIPIDLPVAHLLPALLRQSGSNLADEGLEHDGWVLQRLGERPLEDDHTPAKVGLVDGDTLYLRTRHTQLRPFDFDDVIDGVATGINERADRWDAACTQRLLVAAAAAAALTGVPLTLLTGSASTAGATALLLVTLATVHSRALGHAHTGTVLGLTALPYAALCGLLTPGPLHHPAELTTAGRLAAALLAVTATAVVCAVGIGDGHRVFLGVAITAGGAATAGVVGVLTSLTAAQVAAPLGAIAYLVIPSASIWSFRLAKMRLPVLPATAADLQDNTTPLPSGPLLDSVGVANRFMTSLLVCSSLLCAGCMVVLSTDGSAARATVATLAACLLLRARFMVVIRHRLTLVTATIAGLAVLLVTASVHGSATVRQVAPAGAVTLVFLLLAGARLLPGRRLLPYWGRAAEILESLCAVLLVPLVLGVLHVYSAARGING